LSLYLVGLPQWLILRRQIAHVAWWIAAMALGIGITHGLIDGTFLQGFVPLIMLGSGALLGVLQWLVTRRQVSHAIWWILVSALGWYIAYLLALSAVYANGLRTVAWTQAAGAQEHGLFGLIFGAVYGTLSGLLWLYLLRRKGGVA
jgi:hypothetical protein